MKQKKKMSTTMVIFALKTRHHKVYGDQLKVQGVKDGEPIQTKTDVDLSKYYIFPSCILSVLSSFSF